MLEQNIKCVNFCPYNKKLFCPFYTDYKENITKPSITPDVVPKTIKTKKQSIKPTVFKRKKVSNDNDYDNDNNNNNSVGEPEWMVFNGILTIENFLTCNFEGRMTDFQLGEFFSTILPEKEEDNFTQINLTGKIQTNSIVCDFGGNIELNIEIFLKTTKIENLTLNGTFETNYKSGGTFQGENNESEEVVSMKYYEGTAEFNNEYNVNINLYTSM